MTSTRPPSELLPGSHTAILPYKHNLGHYLLGYHICGDASGRPVFYFHGSPSTRLEAESIRDAAVKQNICVIGVDRPGHGLSTYRPNFNISDWPRDIQLLAEQLSLKTYHAIGCSGGGPFALACARDIPSTQLMGTGLMAGLGPPDSPLTGQSWERYIGFIINKWMPAWVLRFVIEAGLGRHARNPDQTKWRKIVVEGMVKRMSVEDQALITEKEVDEMVNTIRDAAMQGPHGIVHDAQMILRKWPFELSSVNGKVLVWHGTRDTDVPIAMARHVAKSLPNATLCKYPGLSHFSLPHLKAEEMLAELMKL